MTSVLAPASASVSAYLTLQVSFIPHLNKKPVKLQQAMLMASSKAHAGLAAYAVAKVKKEGQHVITLSTDNIDKQLANVVSVDTANSQE